MRPPLSRDDICDLLRPLSLESVAAIVSGTLDMQLRRTLADAWKSKIQSQADTVDRVEDIILAVEALNMGDKEDKKQRGVSSPGPTKDKGPAWSPMNKKSTKYAADVNSKLDGRFSLRVLNEGVHVIHFFCLYLLTCLSVYSPTFLFPPRRGRS